MKDPYKIVNQLAGPTLGPLIQGMLPERQVLNKDNIQLNNEIETVPINLGLEWEAFNDFMRLGNTRVRIYRLEAKLPGGRTIVIRVSRVGEILQVQFPGQLLIDNESIPLRKAKEP